MGQELDLLSNNRYCDELHALLLFPLAGMQPAIPYLTLMSATRWRLFWLMHINRHTPVNLAQRFWPSRVEGAVDDPPSARSISQT